MSMEAQVARHLDFDNSTIGRAVKLIVKTCCACGERIAIPGPKTGVLEPGDARCFGLRISETLARVETNCS